MHSLYVKREKEKEDSSNRWMDRSGSSNRLTTLFPFLSLPFPQSPLVVGYGLNVHQDLPLFLIPRLVCYPGISVLYLSISVEH